MSPRAPRKPAESGRTPMLSQYLELKAEAGDAILFYRMGDFYEMFFEDAQIASRICDLTLTSRNKSDPDPIPMAGVPWHSAEGYLTRLLQAGHRVAICEQVERPGGRGLMDRQIVEILTPGTTVGEGQLEEGRNNYLLALAPGKGVWGLAAADVSTGEVHIGEVGPAGFRRELERLRPREILVPRGRESDGGLQEFLREHPGTFLAPLDDWHFSPRGAAKTLREHWGVASLEPFGIEGMTQGLAAGGALLTYARDQRRAALKHLRHPRALREDEGLLLDESTLRNLEVLEPVGGGREHCLLGVLDHTRTPLGARALRRALSRPLTDVGRIQARHDAITAACADHATLASMRAHLSGIADIERLLARLHCGRARPRDLVRLRDSLTPIEPLIACAVALSSTQPFPGASGIDPASDLRQKLAAALVDDPTLSPEQEIIRDGYDPELDRLRDLARGGQASIAQLQQSEREATGISSLKVGYNKVFGYYLEVTRPHLSRVPAHYERKQTLVSAERFITPELKAWEEKVLGAREGARERESGLIEELKTRVLEQTVPIQRIAEIVAEWDLLASFATRALAGGYVRPAMDEGDRIAIRDGRHPVVEQFLEGESFVPNDLDVDARDRQVQIITGPNMAGKSTFLRQAGLLVIMAQAGSFIPAREARIGVADRVFTRVGASDRIARGQSTFLVEMIETSRIVHEATSRSLVLLDEIGRGTSTFDGLAIAWAVAEHLRERPLRRPRTLFATHFHELTELGRRKEGYRNLNVLVKEWKDQVIFVRRVVSGAADRSYGIQVARLAGLPEGILERARQILGQLEGAGPRNLLLRSDARRRRETQMTLFGSDAGPGEAAPGQQETPTTLEQLAESLAGLDPDRLSPREAQEWLYEWQHRLGKGKPGAVQ